MEKLLEIVDCLYTGICKDNDERPSRKVLDALRDRIQSDSALFGDEGSLVLRQCRIGLHGSLALAKTVPASHLRRLDMSENAIDDCSIVVLLQIADSNPGLQEIYLSSNKIGDDGAREIGKALQNLRQLTCLDLSNDFGVRHTNSINGEGLRLLCDSISKNFSLLSLRLAANHIMERDASPLGHILRLNLTLTHLDLDRNKIGTRGAQILFEALSRNKALRHLHLVGNSIGTDAARAIATMLMMNTSLISLHLAENGLGPAIPDLGDALLKNTSLIVLDLYGNGVDDTGAVALAHVIAYNPYLVSVNLGNNRIGEAGGLALGKSLIKNRVLTAFNLSMNDIRDAAAIGIAEALVNNNSLISLDLSSCKIADDGAVALVTGIGSNKDTELRVLRMRDNYISNSAGQIVLDELQGNTSITTAEFRENRMEHSKLAKIRSYCRRNLNQIRNQVPKKLKENIEELKMIVEQLEETRERLGGEKAQVDQVLSELEAISEEKMHCRLAQQAARDELNKRLQSEEHQLAEIKAKIAQKEVEFAAHRDNFHKQLETKTNQLEIERNQRLHLEEQLAAVKERLKKLEITFDKTPEQLQQEIDQARKEKLKYQNMMIAIRGRYNALQKGYEAGEGMTEYLERARYSLLH